MKKLVISVVLVLLLLGYEWVRMSRDESDDGAKPVAVATPSPTPSPSPSLPTQAERITKEWPTHFAITERSITPRQLDKYGYDLSANYPELISRKPEVRRFNKWIKKKVLGYARDFRKRADAEHRGKGLQVHWGLELGYVVYYSNERFVSMSLTRGIMITGQMHPIRYYETINYDFKRGKQLRTNEVFKRGYLKRLSSYSRELLANQYRVPDIKWMIRGTGPTLDNFANWNIVPDGVLLSFEDYQVGPHSFGQPEFIVPLDALGDTMRQDVFRKLLPLK